jgi:putative hydrolase of the HAD superfamily
MPANRTRVVFDFGNVVAFFDHDRAWARIAAARSLEVDPLKRRIADDALKSLAYEHELGRVDDAAFADAFARGLGLELPLDELEAAWGAIFTLNEPVAALVRELDDAGHTLLLGSNTNPIHARAFRRDFAEVLDRFDHLVLSFEVGHRKPSAAFFAACVAAAGGAPADYLFIDDAEENVEGARSSGLDALVYRDPGPLRDALRARGLLA